MGSSAASLCFRSMDDSGFLFVLGTVLRFSFEWEVVGEAEKNGLLQALFPYMLWFKAL